EAQLWLARLMGFADWRRFTAECTRRSDAVRAACEAIYARLGARAGTDADDLRPCILLLPSPEARADLSTRLTALGFRETPRVLGIVERLAVGAGSAARPAATRRAFADLAPALFEACSRSAHPDQGLDGFQRLAERSVLYRQFYQRFHDEP